MSEEYFHPEIRHRGVMHTTNSSDGAPSVTMDDASYIMDDPTALMGGTNTPEGIMPVMVVKDRVRGR